MTTYTPTIGLEVHAELKTQTKMFCDCKNDPHAPQPNIHICPICVGFPGTLPVINKQAVLSVLRVGVSLSGTIADYTEFDRKNYFYPDIPKGYQISQYKFPLVSGGELNGVAITRIHLEEDTAKSQHMENFSVVDFNRAGVPLMELVTEPVLHTAKDAVRFAEELQLLLRTLGVSDAQMERGEMRVEANISLSKNEILGRKVEVKNLNSFRSVERSIDYEIKRQTEILSSGGEVTQETRGWDESRQVTFSQRKKESAHDYRYFPEPDLPKIRISRISEFSYQNILNSIHEIPSERRKRYLDMGLKPEDVEVLISDFVYRDFFDLEVVSLLRENKERVLATNYLLSDVRGKNPSSEEIDRLREGIFSELILMIQRGDLSSRAGKDILAVLLKEGGKPSEIAKERGLLQVEDASEIEKIVERVFNENPSVVLEYKSGKESSLQFLIGQGMKIGRGAVNPKTLSKIITDKVFHSS